MGPTASIVGAGMRRRGEGLGKGGRGGNTARERLASVNVTVERIRNARDGFVGLPRATKRVLRRIPSPQAVWLRVGFRHELRVRGGAHHPWSPALARSRTERTP